MLVFLFICHGKQVQGRRQHAYQMIISWNCIIPFGFFVSRYYKETYSKVFFLQEYWWYTIHVLCMVTSAIFTFGGIYVMELKRVDAINWEDHNITAHVIIGFAVILLFGFQVLTGFIRVRNIKKRILNIFMHWFLGVLEYLMASKRAYRRHGVYYIFYYDSTCQHSLNCYLYWKYFSRVHD